MTTTTRSDGGSASAGGRRSARPTSASGVALDVGGLGDNGFNDLSKTGLDKAIAEGIVCEENTKFLEANSEGTNLRREHAVARRRGLRPRDRHRVRVHRRASTRSRPTTRTPRSAIIDGYATCGTACGLDNEADAIPNVTDLTFQEEQGSFLVGVAAGLKAQELNCDTVGFLGGQTGTADREVRGRATRPACRRSTPTSTVLVEYIGDTTKAFDDTIGGEALSNKMYDDGACIIYHAAGDSGNGLFKAAAEQQKIAIGVDSDQYEVVSRRAGPLDHDLDDQAGRHGRVRHDRGGGRRQVQGWVPGRSASADEGISYATSNPELMSDDIVDAAGGRTRRRSSTARSWCPTEPEKVLGADAIAPP